MIEFKYIIGANIELFIKASITPSDPETNTAASVEIVSISLAEGADVEIDDICILSNRGEIEPLESLLVVAALEHGTNA